MTLATVLAFAAGAAVGVLAMAVLTGAAIDHWRLAYLNCRDRLWRLERDQGGA